VVDNICVEVQVILNLRDECVERAQVIAPEHAHDRDRRNVTRQRVAQHSGRNTQLGPTLKCRTGSDWVDVGNRHAYIVVPKVRPKAERKLDR